MSGNVTPHSRQNRAPSRLSTRHCGHFIPGPQRHRNVLNWVSNLDGQRPDSIARGPKGSMLMTADEEGFSSATAGPQRRCRTTACLGPTWSRWQRRMSGPYDLAACAGGRAGEAGAVATWPSRLRLEWNSEFTAARTWRETAASVRPGIQKLDGRANVRQIIAEPSLDVSADLIGSQVRNSEAAQCYAPLFCLGRRPASY